MTTIITTGNFIADLWDNRTDPGTHFITAGSLYLPYV
jgi:hypothetical protein